MTNSNEAKDRREGTPTPEDNTAPGRKEVYFGGVSDRPYGAIPGSG